MTFPNVIPVKTGIQGYPTGFPPSRERQKTAVFRYSPPAPRIRRAGIFDIRYFPKRGFSLVETLFYVALLALSLLVVMQTLLVLTRSYAAFRAAGRIERDAALSLERMVREVRGANNIADAGSVFGVHPGRLRLNTTTAAGAARTVEFSVSGGALLLEEAEDGTAAGALTSSTTTVSNLVFRKITTTRSQGVKIEMTLSSGSGAAARSERFYATAVLRNSY